MVWYLKKVILKSFRLGSSPSRTNFVLIHNSKMIDTVLLLFWPFSWQKQATVKSSVLEVLLEISKFCDLYLMERVLDDESEVHIDLIACTINLWFLAILLFFLLVSSLKKSFVKEDIAHFFVHKGLLPMLNFMCPCLVPAYSLLSPNKLLLGCLFNNWFGMAPFNFSD